MRRFINLTNHELSPEQHAALGDFELCELPRELLRLWRNVDPRLDRIGLEAFLSPVREWINTRAKEADHCVVLVHGEQSAVHAIVQWLDRTGIAVPVAATTWRGLGNSPYRFVRWRPYLPRHQEIIEDLLGGKKPCKENVV